MAFRRLSRFRHWIFVPVAIAALVTVGIPSLVRCAADWPVDQVETTATPAPFTPRE